MSRKNKKRRYTQAQLEKKRLEKKQAKLFALQKNITIFSLLIILILGLVSTTFSTSIFESIDNDNAGTLVAQVRTSAQNQKDLADTKANVDVIDTKASNVFVQGEYIYIKNFKPSGWTDPWIVSSGTAWMHLFNSSTNAYCDSEFTLFSGTAGAVDSYYRAQVTTGGTYDKIIFTRGSTGSSIWGGWGQTGNIDLASNTAANCYYSFTTGNTSRSYTYYAVKPSSVTATVTNAKSGTGTSSDPYIVEPGASFTVKLTGTHSDPGMDGFGWNIGSTSSKAASTTSNTWTKTYTASSTANTTTNYTGYAWSYKNTTSYYSSSYATSNKIYVKTAQPEYTYTISAGTGGKVSPFGTGTASSISVTATANTNYTFYEWQVSNGTSSSTTATTTFTPTANNATLKAIFRPNAPSALTLTPSTTISGTGTSADPYIVYKDTGFKFTASATVPTGATARYSTTSGGTYSTTNTFSPITSSTTTNTRYSYAVYAKSYANSIYSSNYRNATVYYKAYTPLSSTATSFADLPDSITDAQFITLSGATVTNIPDAEKSACITQVYQVSTDGSTYEDVAAGTWSPNATDTYYFRVKTTHNVTGDVAYSAVQTLIVTQSETKYNINVVGASGTSTCAVTLKTGNTTITDNKILANEPLTISVVRSNATPENRYLSYITVTDGTTSWRVDNLNADLSDTLVIEHVKGDVTITYNSVVKPYVQPKVPANAASMSFTYVSEGETTTVETAGTYYVDYGTDISYSVTPKSGYYVQSMTGVKIGTITSSTVTGTKDNIIANVGAVTADVTANNTVTVNVDNTSATTTGSSMTIDGTTLAFGTPKALSYGEKSTIVITAPEGYYALVSGNGVNATISTDGKATFDVTLTGSNLIYTVKFVENPTVSVIQPTYGSIYITDSDGNFYLNGDSVGYGTTLNVHVYPDNNEFTTGSVYYTVNGTNYSLSGSSNLYSYRITETSTVSANITGTASNTDYTVTDDKQQQAVISKFTPVEFNYTATCGDYALSYSVVDTNGGEPNDEIRASIANGKFIVTPTTNINDCVLIQLTSAKSVKYYVIRISQFASESTGELQKIYTEGSIPITLSGLFNSAISNINYYVSENNVAFDTLSVTSSNINNDGYTCTFTQTSRGVKYYKITAISGSNEASVTQKAVFGTDIIAGNKSFYLLNQTNYDLSKYAIRICFENSSGKRAWATMQTVSDNLQYYRATIPYGYTKYVSIYLTDKEAHLNVKSGEGNFYDICYYYVENQIRIDNESENKIYKMTDFSYATGMTLQLLQ